MATVRKMTRVETSSPRTGSGALYLDEFTLTAGTESDTITFPVYGLVGIALAVEGDGKIFFSNNSVEKLENDTANFIQWDEVSSVNLAVTAFKITRTSGTVTATVTARTNAD